MYLSLCRWADAVIPHSPVNSWGIAGVCVEGEVFDAADASLGGTGEATLPGVSLATFAVLLIMPAKMLKPNMTRNAQPNFFPQPVLAGCCIMMGVGCGEFSAPIGEPQFGQQATFCATSFPQFVQNMIICDVGG